MNILFWNIKQKWQKLIRGYSDEELWNLDSTFCKWMIPRLKTFKEKTCGFPVDLNNIDEWKEIIQKMIDAFELYISTWHDNFSIEEFKKESTTLKILDIAFIISLIYEILTFNGITICTTILGIIAIVRFYEWFSKKEE